MSAEPWEVAGGAAPSPNSSTPEPWEVAATPTGSVAERLWEGVKGGASRLRDELLPPGNPVHALSMGTVGTDDVAGRKAELAEYERRLKSGELGTAGAIGDVIPEVALTALPIARAGTAISRAPMVAARLGRFAPAAGDIAANAGYEAGKAAYSGEAPGSAAAYGAGGAAAGRVLARTLGGVGRTALPDSTRRLLDAGVTPTPGQSMGGAVRMAEDALTGVPVLGNLVNYSRQRAVGQYAEAELDRALAPLADFGLVDKNLAGKTFEETVANSNHLISKTFETIAPRTYIPGETAQAAFLRAGNEIDNLPLLSDAQRDTIFRYVQQKIAPAVEAARNSGTNVDGRFAKDLDIELGGFIRKYQKSSSPGDAPMVDAFRTLQKYLRGSLEGMDPDSTAILSAANAAYRNMLPITTATKRAGGNMGGFSPLQFQRAAKGDAGPLNAAGRELLSSTERDAGNPIRAITGAIGAASGHGVPLAIGSGVGALLYNPVGLRLMVQGMGGVLPDSTKAFMASLPPAQAADYLLGLVQRYSHLQEPFRNAAAQIGREAATQEPE